MSLLLAASSSTSENFASFDTPVWAWVGFLALVVALLLVDLLVVHQEAHVVTTKEAAIESAVWISIGLAVRPGHAGAGRAAAPPASTTPAT